MTFTRAILIAFACLLGLLNPPAQAQTVISSCPDLPETEISITDFFETPSYDFSEDMLKMRQLGSDHSFEGLQQPVGLAVGELSLGLVMQSSLIVGTDGRICARPKMLRVDAGMQHNKVYVARELPKGSCGFSEVLAHEEGHVAIDRQLLADYKPVLQQVAQSAITQLGTVRAMSPEDADRQMKAFMNDKLQQIAGEINKERARRQALHDTPDEYTRLGKVCSGEVAMAVQKYGIIATQTQNGVSTSAAAPIAPARPMRVPAVVPFSRY